MNLILQSLLRQLLHLLLPPLSIAAASVAVAAPTTFCYWMNCSAVFYNNISISMPSA
jgi:hypothetical protein